MGARRAEPVYPNVRCGYGHPDEPGYIVCVHVTKGAAVRRIEAPTKQKLGIITCYRDLSEHPIEVMLLTCATCVRRNGWDRRAA